MDKLRSRGFCFTINNYTSNDLKRFMTNQMRQQCRYYIFGFEVAPTTGTPHLQGYIYFHNQKSFKNIKKLLGDNAHIEKQHGTTIQNIAYTSKDNKYIEYGDKPEMGERTDLKQIKELVMTNTPIKDIIPLINDFQQLKFMEGLMKYQKPPEPKEKLIKWYYGKSGSGKTRKAIEEGGDDYYISMRDLKWWDGYTGQKTVIIDDFRGDFCTFHELLRILDRYPYRVNVKGSSIWLQAETIIITSCYLPDKVYDTREDIQQLLRRINIVQCFF
jgi:hypothetical protein